MIVDILDTAGQEEYAAVSRRYRDMGLEKSAYVRLRLGTITTEAAMGSC
jgi:hypothetical protein